MKLHRKALIVLLAAAMGAMSFGCSKPKDDAQKATEQTKTDENSAATDGKEDKTTGGKENAGKDDKTTDGKSDAQTSDPNAQTDPKSEADPAVVREMEDRAIETLKKYKLYEMERKAGTRKSPVIATVNGQEIVQDDLDKLLEIQGPALAQRIEQDQVVQVAMYWLVRDAVLFQDARKNHKGATDEEVNAALEKVRESIKTDDFQKRRAETIAKAMGVSIDEYIESLREEAWEDLTFNKYYETFEAEHKGDENVGQKFEEMLGEMIKAADVQYMTQEGKSVPANTPTEGGQKGDAKTENKDKK